MRKYWPIFLLASLVLVVAFGWGGPDVRFPLALVIIRLIVFVTESRWRRARA